MTPVSVLILTKNEERNLPGALQSLAGHCDDVVVLDSGSTDATITIAAAAGARVIDRAFDNYAAQRNFGLAQAFAHDWVLMLDADERVPEDLWQEIHVALACVTPETVMFRMRRKDYLLGKWIRRSSGYPTWFGRLVRPGRVRVIREINEEYVADGQVATLQSHLVHFPFNRGLTHWLDRHNQYSSMEAIALSEERRDAMRARELFASDPVLRRKALKRLAYRLPCRPALIFLYLYFVRLGCLDGKGGLLYSKLRYFYELMIDVKAAELRSSNRDGARR